MRFSETPRDWRVRGSLMNFKGRQIFVGERGQGPPLLALHGFPTASYDYARLAPLLEKHFRLIFFDFLGYGFSDKPNPHPYSLFEQADITQAVAAHFGLERVFLLTHDMGNSVALEVLKRGTPTVDRLFMLNGSVLLKYYRPLLTQRLLLHPLIGPAVTRLGLIGRRAFARQFGSIFAEPPPEDELDAFWSLIQHNQGTQVYHLLIRYLNERKIHEYTWLDALQAHRAPLAVIWGQRDPVSVPQIAQAVLERRPDAVYVPLHAVGHFPQWEAPEAVAKVIFQQIDQP